MIFLSLKQKTWIEYNLEGQKAPWFVHAVKNSQIQIHEKIKIPN
jgi:hypothetical protein